MFANECASGDGGGIQGAVGHTQRFQQVLSDIDVIRFTGDLADDVAQEDEVGTGILPCRGRRGRQCVVGQGAYKPFNGGAGLLWFFRLGWHVRKIASSINPDICEANMRTVICS